MHKVNSKFLVFIIENLTNENQFEKEKYKFLQNMILIILKKY